MSIYLKQSDKGVVNTLTSLEKKEVVVEEDGKERKKKVEEEEDEEDGREYNKEGRG